MCIESTRTAASWFLALALAASSTGGASLAQNVGFRGPSYSGASSSPSGSKSQSKLWWNDGSWWGCLWSPAAQSFTIHRLDATSQTWRDTGTAVDPRSRSHSDCLWDGAKLYIATNLYTSGSGVAGHPLELYRYSYDPNTDVHSLDVGFPVLLGDSDTEVLLIDEDSSGRLWAVWPSQRRLWVTHSQVDGRQWSVPVVHPALTADLSGDDICALVPFQGDKLGLLWSDQVTDSFRFAFRRDADPDTAWSPVETIVSGPGIADDQISLRAAGDGRLFAALKTTSNHVVLAERSAAGAWTVSPLTSAVNRWTRPLLVLDEQHRVLHVFATSPAIQGTIYEKSASMDGPVFGAGIGTPVLGSASALAYNDATSAKQSVSGATGLVVLASQQVRREYGHHQDALGGAPATAPLARFSASERKGFLPLRVQFLDSSSGRPTQWSWTFGDGATSTAQHPLHDYSQAGLYTVTLRVTNALGTNTLTRTGLIQVAPQPTSLVLRPIADGHVRQSLPDSNYGSLTTMRVRQDATSNYRAYLEFFVAPERNQITSAVLRLACTDGSPDGGSLFRVGGRWCEPALTWEHAPALGGAPAALLGSVATGSTVAVDLGTLVTRSGTLSLGLRNASSNSAYYSTREGAHPPELELGLQPFPLGPPLPGFEQNVTAGGAPLTAQFFDTTSGPVSSWLWTFGDGSTSSLQNPSHVFAAEGAYGVSLRVTNASGSNTRFEPDLVQVSSVRRQADLPTGSAPASADPGRRGGSTFAGIAGLMSTRFQVFGSNAALVVRGELEPVFTLELGLAGAQDGAPEDAAENTLEDALDALEDGLPQAGIAILSRSLADGAEGVRAVTLELLGADGTARLVVRPRQPETALKTADTPRD